VLQLLLLSSAGEKIGGCKKEDMLLLSLLPLMLTRRCCHT
jgi:hypothetical protein